MPDQITTKPFVSQAQAGWAFATGQPWAKRWARETGSYKKLPKRKRLKAVCTCTKETLAPGVTRIRGNLCNVHGRWGACDKAGRSDSKRVAPKQLPKAPRPKASGRGRSGRGRAQAKPKTEEQKRQEQEARRAQRLQERQAERDKNRNAVLSATGLSDEAAGTLLSIANGEPGGGDDFGLIKQGLVERDVNGNLRLSDAGRAYMAAADRGDVGAARGALSRGADRAAARAEAERKRLEREKKGKGGGGRAKKPAPPKAPVLPRSTAAALRTPQAPRGGGRRAVKPAAQSLAPALLQAIQDLSEGKLIDPTTQDALIRNGLARLVKGRLVLTATALRAIRTKAMAFTVFKDADGNWRWIARTTTAFEDRDQEVISTKALVADVARADADGLYGPLRWWHMGRPNPLDLAAPWGLGVDLGWCDFNAVSGRTLIESGTFKSEAIARAVAAKADKLELSPGFFHAAGEPDASGVFHHIRRFERSLVPKWAGRASNPYTGLVVEKTMDPKKIQALKELGASDEVVSALLADVQTTEKNADGNGVRYKESHPVVDFFRALFTGEAVAVAADTGEMAVLKAQVEALTAEVAALKAPPPTGTVMDAEDQADQGADEAAEGEPPVDDAGGGGLTLSTDDLDAIGQVFGAVLQSALEPLVGALGITQKLEGHLGELKAMMGGYVKQKDDSAAQQAEELTALKDQVAELVGDASRGGYRPTQANNNTLDQLLLAATKTEDENGNPLPTQNAPFADIAAQLFPQLAQRS